MAHLAITCALALAFVVAGLVNAIGTAATRRDFARWGYPAWWGRLTGLVEIGAAALIAFPATHAIGAMMAAAVLLVATITVVRHRDYAHLVPLAVFAALLAASIATG
jgi:uncharacterized membrane protein YphA (DoxX/SURF4 family)